MREKKRLFCMICVIAALLPSCGPRWPSKDVEYELQVEYLGLFKDLLCFMESHHAKYILRSRLIFSIVEICTTLLEHSSWKVIASFL